MYCFKEPSSIGLYLTSKCDMYCKHCINDASDFKIEELAYDKVIEIIDYMHYKGIKCIDFSGGEPLLHSKFFDILDYAVDQNLRISIVSNGQTPNPEIIKKLCERKIHSIRLSLDGHNQEIHEILRDQNSYNKLIDNYNKYKEHGLLPQIITVIHKKNIEYLEDIISFVSDLGCERMFLIPLIASGRADKMASLMIDKEDWKYILLSQRKLSVKYKVDLAVDSPLLSIVENKRCACPIGDLMIIIKSNGDIIPCSMLDLSIGNIYKCTLQEAWSCNVMKELRDFSKIVECKDCEILENCRGGCRGLSYTMKGDYLCKDPFCWK